MAVEVAFEVDTGPLVRAFEAQPRELSKALARVLLQLGIAHENVIKRNRFRPYRGEAYDDGLQRRSGALANAYQLKRPRSQATAQGLEVVAGIRRGVRGSQYAALQEFGGTIRPKRAQYLTIPLAAALTPSGVLSGRYKIRREGGRFVTDAGETFLFRSKGGNLLIGIKSRGVAKGFIGPGMPRALATGRGSSRELKAFYVLRKSVTVPARFGFFAAWKKLERGLLPKLLRREVRRAEEAAKRAGGGAK